MKAPHRFSTGVRNLALAACAGGAFAAPALAQDSVSTTPGLPGDAVSAFTVGANTEQVNNYVVDLPIKTSSWGHQFRLGPIVKASASTNALWYNHLIASTVTSSVMSPISAPFRPSYGLWTTPGGGVNATRNNAPSALPVSFIPMQSFGVAFLEFSGGADGVFGNSDDDNNLIASIVSLAPQYPGRVYVSRTVAATNKTAVQAANSTLGLGMIDPAGNLVALGDGVGLTGPNPITNKKIFRLNSAARSTSTVNMLSESGGADTAATRIVSSGATTQTTPTLIPSSLAGGAGRPVTLGTDLANNFLYEGNANSLTSTTSHLGAGVSGRGTLSFSPSVFNPLGTGTRLGTAAILSRATSTTKTRGISAWSLTANGAPTGTLRVEMPTGVGQLTDLDDNFDPSAAFGSPENQEFTNYQSQTIYRGPNGPVATTVLPGGDLLMAATVAATGSGAAVPAGMDNYIAVARVNASTQAVSWTIAAHTGNAQAAAGGLSKAIYGDNGADGIPGTADAGEGDGVVDGTPIGQLCLASEASPGVTTGPSLSAPAMDSLGNIYFMSGVQLLDGTAQVHRNSLALLKANYNRATGGYRLELIAELNTVLAGLNSGRNYQVQFFSVADADSIDSGTIWSSSIVPQPLAGVDASILPYGSPLSLGALVFRAKIVYDTNASGTYIDPTLPGGSGADEAYNVAMLLLPARRVADIGGAGGLPPGDGVYDNNDFIVFINAFFNGNNAVADIGGAGGFPTPDGALDNNDFIAFIDAFFNLR